MQPGVGQIEKGCNAGGKRQQHRGAGMHAAQHLAKRKIKAAQIGVMAGGKIIVVRGVVMRVVRRIAIRIVSGMRMAAGVPRRMA